MEKKNVLRVLTTIAIAVIVNVGIMAQNPPSPFAVYDANETAPTNWDSVTTGMTMPYYVLPDAYYHPNYVTLGTLTAGFTWTFEIYTNPGTASFSSQTDNYVEIAWGGTGDHAVRVFETADAAYGGCDGDTTIMNVRVLPAPTLALQATGGGFIGDSIEVCEGDAQLADNVRVNLTGVIPFNLIWDFEIATYDASRTKDEYFGTDKVSLGAVQAYAVEYTALAPDSVVTAAYNLDRPDDNTYDVINNKTTVYSYSITGVNGKISRKSDYLLGPTQNDDFNYWDVTAANNVGGVGNTLDGVVIIINPRPDTGPIYHIPNDWAE